MPRTDRDRLIQEFESILKNIEWIQHHIKRMESVVPIEHRLMDAVKSIEALAIALAELTTSLKDTI